MSSRFSDVSKHQGVKHFYDGYHDRILDKRYNSPHWIRRYTHRQIYEQILRHIQAGQRVLDAGCGEGILSLLAARKGATVTGVDISYPNIISARHLASAWDCSVEFLQADSEILPFSDDSFDVVMSSHVIEHLPNLLHGIREIHRVTRKIALIAMPTCLNPACWVLLAGDDYWKLSYRSLVALPLGFTKVMLAWLRGDDGPNEGYAGNQQLPHVWRFPWVMRRRIEEAGLKIISFEAGPLTIPYIGEYLSLARSVQMTLDNIEWRSRSILRYFGYGSLAICRKGIDRGEDSI